MRNVLAVGIWMVTGLLSVPAGAQNLRAETLLRWHFAGTKALLQEADLKAFQEIHNMPETARLRDEILSNLALKAAHRFTRQPANEAAAKSSANLIKPLLQQMLESESRLILTSLAAEKADWALAVHAPGETAHLWSTNLWQLVHSSRLGQPAAQEIDGEPGWSAQGDRYNLAFARENDWILFAGGHSAAQVHERALADLKKSLGEKTEDVLAADINLPAFAKLTGHEKLAHAPRLSLTSRPRAEGFRSELDLEYPQDLGLKPERWEVPRDLIHDPLIGFTAIQGLREKLSESEHFTNLKAENTPNQLFVWSQSITPFSISAAANVGNPREVVKNLAAWLEQEKGPEIKKNALGELRYNSTNHSLIWSGLPIIVPFARPGWEPNDDYLTMGLFPLSKPGTNAAPAGLFEQLDKENLVYYAWEITGARIAQWRPLWQMSRFLRGKQIPGPTSASETWLPAIASKLQNTITEATLEGPRSLKVTRQSQLGLNALELVLLAHLADRYDAPPAQAPSAHPGNRPRPSAPPPLNNSSRRSK